jgi:hypothetical protein
LSHPLIELANDRAVRQAAEFRRAAEEITQERLAELYAAERDAAPSVHEAGRTYFVKRSGKAPTERKKNRDEEHVGSALIRSEPEIGYPLPDDAGYLKLLDYQVRAKVGPADDPDTKGISRFDLLGIGPEDRLTVICLRYLEPTATRCRVGDTPLRQLLHGLTYHAIATANQEALSGEITERFGVTPSAEPPLLMMIGSPRYWELCRKRSTQKGAAWIRELERIASDAQEVLGFPVHFLSLRLEEDPGWSYGEEGPEIEGRARLGLAWEPGAGRVKPKARPRARARTEPVEVEVEADLSRPVRGYDLHESYSAGDRIDHPKLGTGVVQGVAGPGKIRVKFDERQSVLVHERGA